MRQEHLESASAERPKALEWMGQHLDFVAAIVVVILIALHFLGVLLPLPEGSADVKARLASARKGVDTVLRESRYDTEKPLAEVQARSQRLKAAFARRSGDAPPAVEGLTYSPALLNEVRKGSVNEVRFEPPVDVLAKPDVGVIKLTWAKHEENNVAVSSYLLLRAEGSGGFIELSKLGKDVTSYDDRAVKPGNKYSYRVIAMTDDPMVLSLKDRTEPSKPATSEALADFKLTLLEVDIEKKTAEILVEKYKDDHWFQKRFPAVVGGIVGRNDEGSGVDYGTGRILVSLDSEPATETRTRREVVFDADAKVKLQGDIPVTEEISVVETFQRITAHFEGANLPPADLTLDQRPVLVK